MSSAFFELLNASQVGSAWLEWRIQAFSPTPAKAERPSKLHSSGRECTSAPQNQHLRTQPPIISLPCYSTLSAITTLVAIIKSHKPRLVRRDVRSVAPDLQDSGSPKAEHSYFSRQRGL